MVVIIKKMCYYMNEKVHIITKLANNRVYSISAVRCIRYSQYA